MSQFIYTPAPFMQAWREYQDISAAARAAYLDNVTRAYREYLDTPYPDRPAYETAERNYWLTYYHTCRQAWRRLENTMPAPPPPPAPVPEHKPAETISGPYQVMYPYDHHQPVFHPNEESDH